MRGASVVRRRSGTNLGETAAGSVNGRQADGGGSGLLAGGSATGAGAVARRETDPSSRSARGTQQVPQAITSAAAISPTAGQPGTATRPAAAGGRRPPATRSRMALSNWRVRWRLAAIIAVPTLTSAILGSLFIYGDVNNWNASGRVQHLAQLNAAVVVLTQKLEDERDLSAGYAAVRSDPGSLLARQLTGAQQATNTAVTTVVSDANGVGAGYQPDTQQDLTSLLN